ncbi:MAG: lysine transporter LysE [Rhizobiales bacterium]|nr:lysine transporter LysE [Hyphomicrobiales bacterium]
MIPDHHYILAGLALGILVAAPVGPVNIICIQRTLERGFWGGIAAGLGAVLADGVLAMAAASGITAITKTIDDYGFEIQLIGGGVLAAFGLKLMAGGKSLETDGGAPAGKRRLADKWTAPQTFLLTITNPGAVLGIFALVGGTGTALGGFTTYRDAFTFVISVMAGSMLWWTGLSRVISTLRHRLTARRLLLINRISGGVLLAFGALLIVRSLLGYVPSVPHPALASNLL